VSDVLDFLSPSLAREERGFHPVARTALEPLFGAAGATFVERGGWRLAVSVPGEADAIRTVGIADLSHLAKLEVRPAPASFEAAPGGLQQSVARSVVAYRLSPRRALVLFAENARKRVTAQLAEATTVLDATAAYAVLALSGPEARALIGRLTHLHHFPSGGDVAHVTAHVLQSGNGFRILVAQELGLYLAEVALDCAQALGGGLVGLDALPKDELP
jgi:glycine cleavage system aminomethyltransferase T